MQQIISIEKSKQILKSGHVVQYLNIPEIPYHKLSRDLKLAKHFQQIREVTLNTSDGVIIKGYNKQELLMACMYAMKKYEKGKYGDECYDEEEDKCSLEISPEETCGKKTDEEYIEEFNNQVCDSNGRVRKLIIVPYTEIIKYFYEEDEVEHFGFGQMYAHTKEENGKIPVWLNEDYPIMTLIPEYALEGLIKPLSQLSRFCIVAVNKTESKFDFRELENDTSIESRMVFELDYEVITIKKPEVDYYTAIMKQIVKSKGYKLASSLDTNALIENLISYRSNNFEGAIDIERLLNRVIKLVSNKTLGAKEFAKVIKEDVQISQLKGTKAMLDQVVGLVDEKKQLMRIMQRMHFNKKRAASGFKKTDDHMAAVFMGNPGTAKTTLARIFGAVLCEEGVLKSQKFKEVSRKDLIAEYVGWTAPKVEKVFKEIKGGTLFIDEAYSLLEDHEGYAEEAMAEIVLQMENNPDTLVIFAGYPEPMKKFICNANPGLRSRLTNIMEFRDYTPEELFEIFLKLVEKDGYQCRGILEIKKEVFGLMERLKNLNNGDFGNGRLMRKLLKTSIAYKAERNMNEFKTIIPSDVHKAVEEIYQAEQFISNKSTQFIGFKS